MKQSTPVGLNRKLFTASGAFVVSQARVRCRRIFISAEDTACAPT
jgi:hypothetical protein